MRLPLSAFSGRRSWLPAVPAVTPRRCTALVFRASAARADRSVGIDLGTTNSAIAVVEAGVPRIIPTADGPTTPSVVFLRADGEVLVGAAAKRVAAQQPLSTFYSTKRLIGRRIKDVKRSAPKLAYSVDGDADGAIVLECSAAPTGRLRPEEIGAHVLRYLLAAAEADLDAAISRAVISVPAYFDPAQRAATIAAGKLAGLDKVRLIREPVAAALAYGLDLQQEATVLVADLGGGTFDVALLEVGGGTAEVLSTGGDAHLGGDDWDAAIAQHINDKHLKPAGIRVRSPQTWARLRSIAESAKMALSSQNQVLLRIPLQQPPLEVLLTQQHLDSLAVPLFKRALTPLEDACQQAGVDLQAALEKAQAARQRGDGTCRRPTKRAAARAPLDVQIRPKQRPPISEVLLVGGATRMPAFRRFITNVTGLEPRLSAVDPDEVVALGAAVQAAMLEGELSDFMVLDVWQASLMRAFAGNVSYEQVAEAGAAAERAAPAAELGVAVEDISEQDLADAAAEFEDLSEEEIDALLAADRGDN